MQHKSMTLKPVTSKGKNFQDFMLPVYSSKFKQLMAQSKYSGREPRNRVQLDDALVKLFQVVFEIDVETCNENEWTERISIKGRALNLAIIYKGNKRRNTL